jgi:hypothetical protein
MNDTRDVELNAIGVLKRREIEARILAPLIEALGREFGREKVLRIVRETVVGIARDQGRQLVQIGGGNCLPTIRCGHAKLAEGRCSGDRSISAK